MNILVEVFCGSERHLWINPNLAVNLLEIAATPRHRVSVQFVKDRRPISYARNHGLTVAQQKGVDWLLMCDNDQSFHRNPLAILGESRDKKIIGFPSFRLGGPDAMPVADLFGPVGVDGNFVEVQRASSGAMLIHRDVWTKIPAPWFEPLPTRTDFLGTGHFQDIGEDHSFCDLARRAGFKIWVATQHGLNHYHTVELSRLALTPLERRC